MIKNDFKDRKITFKIEKIEYLMLIFLKIYRGIVEIIDHLQCDF